MVPGDQDGGNSPEGKAGFKVSDRRSFSESGQPTAPPGSTPGPSSAPATTGAAPAPSATSPAGDAPPAGSTGLAGDSMGLPPVDFHTFILSLGSSALLHLGELDDPGGSDEARPDLPMAKHTIDIIAMLQEKTRGNLSAPEERLMESLLYDLRLRYVERNKLAAGPRVTRGA